MLLRIPLLRFTPYSWTYRQRTECTIRYWKWLWLCMSVYICIELRKIRIKHGCVEVVLHRFRFVCAHNHLARSLFVSVQQSLSFLVAFHFVLFLRRTGWTITTSINSVENNRFFFFSYHHRAIAIWNGSEANALTPYSQKSVFVFKIAKWMMREHWVQQRMPFVGNAANNDDDCHHDDYDDDDDIRCIIWLFSKMQFACITEFMWFTTLPFIAKFIYTLIAPVSVSLLIICLCDEKPRKKLCKQKISQLLGTTSSIHIHVENVCFFSFASYTSKVTSKNKIKTFIAIAEQSTTPWFFNTSSFIEFAITFRLRWQKTQQINFVLYRFFFAQISKWSSAIETIEFLIWSNSR